MKYLRFYDIRARIQHRTRDTFSMFYKTLKPFINSQACYFPGENLPIDEQLFQCKSMCSFIQYKASKPEKFKIKFWCLVDNKRKYLSNTFPYLEKEPKRRINCTVLLYVCEKMLNPYFNKSCNVTMDKYFTALLLAKKFLSKNTTIADTERKELCEIPNRDTALKKR